MSLLQHSFTKIHRLAIVRHKHRKSDNFASLNPRLNIYFNVASHAGEICLSYNTVTSVVNIPNDALAALDGILQSLNLCTALDLSALPSVLGPARVVADTRTPAQRTADSARMVSGTFAILLVIAIGVLLFAGPNLDEVVATIEREFAQQHGLFKARPRPLEVCRKHGHGQRHVVDGADLGQRGRRQRERQPCHGPTVATVGNCCAHPVA